MENKVAVLRHHLGETLDALERRGGGLSDAAVILVKAGIALSIASSGKSETLHGLSGLIAQIEIELPDARSNAFPMPWGNA